jgi:hypothetical protein
MSGALSTTSADATITATSGSAAILGWTGEGDLDYDADGLSDLAIGAPGDDTKGTLAGAVFLFYGPVTGTNAMTTADKTWQGDASNSELGTVAAVGDLDGDGTTELLLGSLAYGSNNAGRAYLVFGQPAW